MLENLYAINAFPVLETRNNTLIQVKLLNMKTNFTKQKKQTCFSIT